MRKLMPLALALVLSLALAAPAAAADVGTSGSTGSVPVTISAEATTFSVTVPTSIPLNVDANAAVTCANNLKIINNSAGPVEVTAIAVQNDAWSIVSFNGGNRSSLASEKVNSNKLGLALKPSGGTQIATSTTGNQDLTPTDGEWVIPAGGNLPFECAGIATAVSASASNVEAAKVVFTLAWKESDSAPTLISFTIDGTSYQAEEGMTWGEWFDSIYNTVLTTSKNCESCGKSLTLNRQGSPGFGYYNSECSYYYSVNPSLYAGGALFDVLKENSILADGAVITAINMCCD